MQDATTEKVIKPKRGMRLGTTLVLTYSLVGFIAVFVAVLVALPFLQEYQNQRLREEYQRQMLEYTGRLESMRSLILNSNMITNPFREYIPTRPATPAGQTTAPLQRPPSPSIELVRQKFDDMAVANGNLRLLVMTIREREVLVDTTDEPAKSWQGQVLKLSSQSVINPTPVSGNGRNGLAINETIVFTSDGKPHSILLSRQISGESAPALFGLNNQQQPLAYVIATSLPIMPEVNVTSDLAAIFGIAVVAALAVALLAGFLLARTLTKPLIRLTRATEAVAQGDYTQQVPASASYELDQLSKSFNQMTENVAKSHHAQRQLVENVSHELKTPLTTIRGFSEAMLDGALKRPEDYARPATIIHSEAERMTRLVNSLLELSKYDLGEIHLQYQEFDLSSLLKETIETFQPDALKAGIDLLADFRPPLLIYADRDRIRQVFNNLIDNALKFTPSEGIITVSASQRANQLIVTVTDSGSGMPAGALPYIFDRFYQADKSRRRNEKHPGSGLGLAIAKEIVQAHQGKIAVSSFEGKGSTFTVTLPAVVNNSARELASNPPEIPASLPLVNNK